MIAASIVKTRVEVTRNVLKDSLSDDFTSNRLLQIPFFLSPPFLKPLKSETSIRPDAPLLVSSYHIFVPVSKQLSGLRIVPVVSLYNYLPSSFFIYWQM